MATDDERREVAERLRMSDERDAAGFDCLLAEVVRGREFCETPCEHCHGRLLGELADLIDPDTTGDTTTNTTKSAEDTTKVPDSHPDCGTEEEPASRVPECDATAAHAAAESGHESGQNRDSVQIRVQKGPECDRGALLALAEQLDGLGNGYVIARDGARDVARRIREACGMADAG